MKRVAWLLGTISLGACSTLQGVPDMVGEAEMVFPVAPEAPTVWAAAGVVQGIPESDWLAQFNDETMIALVNEALVANPSLRAQYYAVQAAQAQARAIYGRSLPAVSASASAGGVSNYIEALDQRSNETSYGLGLDASWQVDLWGRIRSGIDAAEADVLASEADLASAQLSIVAQTAIAWIDLNTALALERVAVETYEARQRTLDLTERRFARGLSTALGVRTARTSLASAEASIAARRQASANAVRRLEILVGRYPAAALEAPARIPELDPIHVAGNPAMLLSRRPDIAASEARLTAAGLRAEQARLAMLPGLTLSGSVSNSEDDISDIFDPSRFAARLIASLAAPIFNGGALKADADAARSRALAAVETYASATLAAWREVEDAITADQLLAKQEEAQSVALEEARLAEDLATRQYTNGLVSIFDLINSQTARLNAESNLISASASRAINRIQFHLALGGGLPVAAPAPSSSQNRP